MRDKRKNAFRARYGPWAVVTGASSGIGMAIAGELAQIGLNLILVARRREILEELAEKLSASGGVEIKIICLDLADESSDEQLAAMCRNLDVGLLVAAAGFGTSGTFLSSNLEIEMLMVNCRAAMTACFHFGQRFARRGRGGIILLSSIVGFQGMPYAAHYAATKAYIQTLAEGLQTELAADGVDVLAVAPGPVASGFADHADMRMGKALRPEEIAEPILNALGRKTTILPGFLSKLLAYSVAPLPRFLRVKSMGSVMRGMTKHQNQSK